MSTAIHTGARRKAKLKPRQVQPAKPVTSVTIAKSDPPSKSKIVSPPIASPYLTTAEAAAYLKLSRQFLEGARYRDDGTGPAYVKAGKTVRYIQSALDEWMTANVHPAKTSRI